MIRYPHLFVLCFSALLLPAIGHADESTPPSTAPAPSASATALTNLEMRSPKDRNDRSLIPEINAEVIRLAGSNQLSTVEDYSRAARLIQIDMNGFRTARVLYELQLTAAAMGDPGAQAGLCGTWDSLLQSIGRPYRIDVSGIVPAHPEFFQLEAAPACIQSVFRNPAEARANLAAAQDNPEIKTIVDADQAVRKNNWDTLTVEQRKAISDGDLQRNARVRAIVSSGEVHTANDFARASLVMQHSAQFAGFQLAHELAVCSMLLGDRQTGRWLVTATYDRMLRSVGHDQRFGTQMGPNGPLQVDETGICDAERQALGCPTLAQARSRQSMGSRVVSKLTKELIGPDNTIRDTKNNVSATFPLGWAVTGIIPVGEQTISVSLTKQEHADATLGFYYRILAAPFAVPANGPEAFLREEARKKATDRITGMPDYRNRPESFVFQQIHGQPSLSWIADYTRDGRKWSEYLTRILGPGSVALLFLNAPAEEIEVLRPAVDGIATTVRLP